MCCILVLCGTNRECNVGNCIEVAVRLTATEFCIRWTEGLTVQHTNTEKIK